MAMSKRKFYKTKVSITILSEEPLSEMSLSDLDYFISEGDGVGGDVNFNEKKINAKQAVKMLEQLGSEAGFFQLNDDGSDGDGDEDEDEG